LVFPVDADITKQRVSVLTPIGAALIGIGKGASIDWETNSCELRHLTILDVKN
jgi:regulator of nucleoside diphosphate kinase